MVRNFWSTLLTRVHSLLNHHSKQEKKMKAFFFSYKLASLFIMMNVMSEESFYLVKKKTQSPQKSKWESAKKVILLLHQISDKKGFFSLFESFFYLFIAFVLLKITIAIGVSSFWACLENVVPLMLILSDFRTCGVNGQKFLEYVAYPCSFIA